MNRTLPMLREGQRAVVTEVLPTGALFRRLQDIGLIAGTSVQCLLKSPFGDPTAYLIRGTMIALRAADATCILIDEEPCIWD